jgi:CDP-glucose 4,6-dehydratase
VENLVMINRKFWQGKKVLITGHTGFKGSWLCLVLQRLGAEVIGFALPPPTTPNMFSAVNIAKGMVSVLGDIRDLTSLQKIMNLHEPEIVIHMAAQSLVRYSYQHPVETYATNVMGTVNLLQAIRSVRSVRVVINVTSDKCYQNKEVEKGYKETDVLGGYDPYSNSKACSELITASFRDTYFKDNKKSIVSLATVREGNVIGGGDWAKDRLIPDVISAYLHHKPVEIRFPNAIRPWQHILEPLYGYLLLAESMYATRDQFSEAWNFGPDVSDAKTVNEVATYLCQLL